METPIVVKLRLTFGHDWYALGQLIFRVHNLIPPSEASIQAENTRHRAEDFWEDSVAPPSEEEIKELLMTLDVLEQAGYSIAPNVFFNKGNTIHVSH
jgi:hypothetical protein